MSYKEDILRLRAEGKSYSEISHELGCSKGTVAYYLKEDAPAKVVASNPFAQKIINYVDNFKETRPCISCGAYYHKSQLDVLDDNSLDSIIATVVDKETFEKSKRKISQLKFICANDDRLRKFRAAN
jgi:predicted transcriptional regulator